MESSFSTTSSFDSFELQLTATAQEHLRKTSGWGTFLAVTWFILLALGTLFSLVFLAVGGTAMATASANGMPFPATAFGLIMLIFNIMGWIPAIALFRFSGKIKKSIEVPNSQLMTEAFRQLKLLFTIMGVYVIITIVTYIAFVVYAFSLGASMANGL